MNYEATLSGTGLLSQEEIQDRRKKRLVIAGALLLILAVAAGLAYYFASASGEKGAADETAAQAQSVTVIVPAATTVARSISATGTLAARREVPVGVVGEGGRVTQVYVDAGDWVKQGQTLVSIDRSVQAQQAEALRAQIGVAKADLQLAQNELSRAQALVSRGFISKADVDRRIANRDSAHARLHVSEAQYNQVVASNARLTIVAPVSGYVLERNVEPGQTASPGSGPLFRIAKDGQMELQAQVGETDLAELSIGVTALVTPAGSDRQFSGQIWQKAPIINEQTRQGIARIALPFDTSLRPGGFASAEIKAGATTATMLPESAVQNDRKGNYVYVISKDNKAVRRDVKTGAVSSDGVPIIEGLNGTEKIVLFAGGFLNPGETVIPKLQKAK
jgi:HlyD family secretion protein